MSVNKYKIIKPNIDDLSINLPVQMNWDYLGQQDSIDSYEDSVVDKITENKIDYELTRFSPKKCQQEMNVPPEKCFQLNFEFFLFKGKVGDKIIDDTQWVSSFSVILEKRYCL